MGLKKWIARKGAVGSTARWAAKLYTNYRRRYPDISDEEIYKMILESRYDQENAQRAVNFLFTDTKDESLLRLVMTVLYLEAGFMQNSIQNQILFLDIIEEELAKKGIDEIVIKGKG